VRKRSDSNRYLLCESAATATNLYCAKAKRQQQIFTVRKRSDSNKSLLCESEATATDLYCAKAQRQQQMFTVRKRSDSNKCFCTKVKRQVQNTSTSIGGEMNAVIFLFSGRTNAR